jgi:COP9 signalosome complex subunit 3
LARAPRWTIKQLTETYLTLGLAEIGHAVGVDDAEEVRRVVLSMVRSYVFCSLSLILTIVCFYQIDEGEINASISADGTVAFADDVPVRVSKEEIDAVLARVQEQERVLRTLEREMARSKEYLNKVSYIAFNISASAHG